MAIDGDTEGGAATAAEVDLRIARVVKMIISGSRRSDLIAFGATEWGVSSRTIDRYIASARAEIRQDWELERTDMLAATLTRLSELEALARKSGQLSVALGAINAMARLAQLQR